jgi:hypothetical protein
MSTEVRARTPNRPGELAEALQRAPVKGRMDAAILRVAIAEFLDTFYLDPDPDNRKRRLTRTPTLIQDPNVDAFMGAVGEHLCSRWALGQAPGWTEAPERFLKRPAFMGPERLKPFLLMESPTAFRRRLIFTEAEPLRRARMPRDGRWWAYEKLRTGLTPEVELAP